MADAAPRIRSRGDPFGVRWGIATHTEDVSPGEIGRRAAEAFKQT